MKRYGPAGLLAFVLVASWAAFRPGIVMTDTLTRWAGAYTLAGKLGIWWGIEQWLAPTMTWFMYPVAALGIGVGYFLGAQVGYLLVASLLWVRMTSSERPWWIPLTFCVPLVFMYVSFVVPDAWTLAAIIAVVGALYSAEAGRRVSAAVLFGFSCLVLFGFRQNSLVLLPVTVFLFGGCPPRWLSKRYLPE